MFAHQPSTCSCGRHSGRMWRQFHSALPRSPPGSTLHLHLRGESREIPKTSAAVHYCKMGNKYNTWLMRTSDRDRDISLRFRRQVSHMCPDSRHMQFTCRRCPWTQAIYWSPVSNPVMQSVFRLFVIVLILVIRMDTGDLFVACIHIWIWVKYLYIYLRLKVLTTTQSTQNSCFWEVFNTMIG